MKSFIRLNDKNCINWLTICGKNGTMKDGRNRKKLPYTTAFSWEERFVNGIFCAFFDANQVFST
jgi:hypothetical protein